MHRSLFHKATGEVSSQMWGVMGAYSGGVFLLSATNYTNIGSRFFDRLKSWKSKCKDIWAR